MSLTLLIRRATALEARRISYLIQKNVEADKQNGYSPIQKRIWQKWNTPAAIRKQLEHRIIFCAFANGRLIGTIGLEGNKVVGLYISQSKRGQGIGKQLLQYLEDYAHNEGHTELILEATPSGQVFYTSKGFEEVEAITTIIDGVAFPEMKMRKKL